jgi:Helicase HerA, central domain
MIDVPAGRLYLGEQIDASSRKRDGTAVLLEAADLTTHGVVVGMTGSGKTGLGVVLVEEALLAGVPTLVLDPKGDLGNLLLTFPDLRPEGCPAPPREPTRRPWATRSRGSCPACSRWSASTPTPWRAASTSSCPI